MASLSKIALAAGSVFALTFIFGCSGDDANNGGGSNFLYSCQLPSTNCIRTITASDCSTAGGYVVDACPASSSSGSSNGCDASSYAAERVEIVKKYIREACKVYYNSDLVEICVNIWEEKVKTDERFGVKLLYDVASGSECINLDGSPEMRYINEEVAQVVDRYIPACKNGTTSEVECPDISKPIPPSSSSKPNEPEPPSSSSSARSSSSSAGLGACSGGTVTIGSQVWQKCNSNAVPSTGNSWCYGNQESNCAIYGRLYDWAAVMSVCPSGWHLPSKAEWDALTTYVESNKGCTSCDAKHLKSASGWDGNGNGLDSYGFSALPGGYGYSGGYFSNVGDGGYWWSASEGSSGIAYYRFMYYDGEIANWYDIDKSILVSVRCLQD